MSGEVLTCTTAEADVTGLDTGDSVTLQVTYLDDECEDSIKTVQDGGSEDLDDDDGEITARIDLTTHDGGRCYCTPDELIVWEGTSVGGTELSRFDPGLDPQFCEPSFTVDPSCTEVVVTASDIIDGCSVTATVNYDECPSDSFQFTTDSTHTFDVPCYCTPTSIEFSNDNANGADLSNLDRTFSVTDCEPTLHVTADCEAVTVSATDVLADCPIDATVTYDECSSETKRITGDGTTTFDVPCYCTPQGISFVNVEGGADLSNFDQTFDLACEPSFVVNADCEEVTVDPSGVLSDCPIDVTVTYDECTAETKRITTNDLVTFDVPCYCTPQGISFVNVENGADLSNLDRTFSVADCEPTLDVSADCEAVTVSATDVLADCPIDATVTYDECSSETKRITGDGTTTFDVPCYCTPQGISFVNVENGADLSNFDQTFDLSCKPSLDATADCKEVVVTASGLLSDCDVEATVSFVEDDCSSQTQVLANGDTTFTVPCYCTPESVSYVNTDPDGADLSGFNETFSGLDCGVTLTTLEADCQKITVEGSGVPECPVTVDVTFAETDCSLDPVTFTAASDGSISKTIDVPCYCTPTEVTVHEGSSTSDPVVRSINPDPVCTPSFDATFRCDRVDVSGSNLVGGCPVTATVSITADTEEEDLDPSCPSTVSHDLTASDPSHTFDLSDLECGCEPESVEFTLEGTDRVLDTISAGALNCICTDFTEVCKIEERQIEGTCPTGDGDDTVKVDCGGVSDAITFHVTECKEGEVICFNFESEFPIFEVFVKGGGGRDTGNRYTWHCGTTDSRVDDPTEVDLLVDEDVWTGELCANKHPRNEKQTAVSHVEFYVCAEDLD